MHKTVLVLALLFAVSATGCRKDIPLEIAIQLTYQGEPLVLDQSMVFPDGKAFRVLRVSFYVSDLMVSDGSESILLKEVDFVNPSAGHLSSESAAGGYPYIETKVDLETIKDVSFNLGLTEAQNESVPADFSTDHPQSKPGEYWLAWDSYIFIKIEGWVDLDDDGDAETGMNLHLGSDAVMRPIQLNAEGLGSRLKLEVDLYDVFKQEQVYDIAENPGLHSLSQLPAAEELADNFSKSITIKSL
ncbi:MAG: hypothetical protein KTR24_17725 [Saprospiraceae bacterium]|nr:hypothetical protein [Saprospiraceae bacterium]